MPFQYSNVADNGGTSAKSYKTKDGQYHKAEYGYAATHRETEDYNKYGWIDKWSKGDFLYNRANRAFKNLTGKRLSELGVFSPSLSEYSDGTYTNVNDKNLNLLLEQGKDLLGEVIGSPGSSGYGSGRGGRSGSGSGSGVGSSDSYDSIMQLINDTTQANNEWSAQQAQLDREWQEYMSSTAHQREVADLKAAGLNPVLSAGGSGASTPSGAMGQTDTSNTRLLAEVAMAALENASQSAGALGTVAKGNLLSNFFNSDVGKMAKRAAVYTLTRKLIYSLF